MAVRANGWAGRFVYYCLLACGPQLETATTGLIPGLSRPDILERLMAIPSLPEQTAIAGVLSDMDAEIAAIERRRDKTRLLKQGMMQELLTGRIRLV
jgi:restriction endonuclease S subunit